MWRYVHRLVQQRANKKTGAQNPGVAAGRY